MPSRPSRSACVAICESIVVWQPSLQAERWRNSEEERQTPSPMRYGVSKQNSKSVRCLKQALSTPIGPIVVFSEACAQGGERSYFSPLGALRAAVLRRAVGRFRSHVLRADLLSLRQTRWRMLALGKNTKGGLSVAILEQRPNPSIEGTSTSKLRLLAAAPHVKR